MPKIVVPYRIPTSDQETRIYLGDLMLTDITTYSTIGHAMLSSYVGVAPLGMGSEKVVYPHHNRSEIAVAFYVDRFDGVLSVDELKRKYHIVKLMHLLLPKHIPDARLVGSDPAMMYLDRVIPLPPSEDFEERRSDLFKLARSLGVYLDPKPNNFLTGPDGYMRYVDDFGMSTDTSALSAAVDAIEDPFCRSEAFRHAAKASLELAA